MQLCEAPVGWETEPDSIPSSWCISLAYRSLSPSSLSLSLSHTHTLYPPLSHSRSLMLLSPLPLSAQFGTRTFLLRAKLVRSRKRVNLSCHAVGRISANLAVHYFPAKDIFDQNPTLNPTSAAPSPLKFPTFTVPSNRVAFANQAMHSRGTN